MDTLFEWGILSLVGLIIYGVLRVLVHSWREASKNYDKKLSEDYRRAVERHQLSECKEIPSDGLSGAYERLTSPIHKNNRAKVIDRISRGNSVPTQLVDSNFNLWGLDSNRNLWDSEPIRDTETERLLDSIHSIEINGENLDYTPSYEGSGHGGSFGGGGVSGSWGSDDNSSSSYDSGSSDSGGSDSSSSD